MSHLLHTHTHIHTQTHTCTLTDRQTDRRRDSIRQSCPPKDEFLFCLGKRMWSHSLKIQPMSLATHDLIQASPLCRAPSPSPLLLLLSLALPVASYLLPLPICLFYFVLFFYAITCHVLGCRFSVVSHSVPCCHLDYTKHTRIGLALCMRTADLP